MREIIFRGKRKDNGEWIFGYYFQRQNLFSEDGFPITHHISYLPPFGAEVDAETVGQFSGLTDKNGKRIFEGDIIRKTNEGRHSQIFTADNRTSFCTYEKVYYGPFDYLIESCEYEVIGNIHDNPELLCYTKNEEESCNCWEGKR